MKATDLMIGDWVKVNDVEHQHPMQVAEIKKNNGTYYATLFWDGMPEDAQPDHCLAEIEVIQPIPLTPEILEKNGFIRGFGGGNKCLNYHEYADNLGDFDLYICNGIREGSTCEEIYEYVFTAIRYVHELQHAFKLCNYKQEFKLV